MWLPARANYVVLLCALTRAWVLHFLFFLFFFFYIWRFERTGKDWLCANSFALEKGKPVYTKTWPLSFSFFLFFFLLNLKLYSVVLYQSNWMCVNKKYGNPEKIVFGFNIRYISRSLKNGCLQLHMCAVKPKILFVNFEVIFKIQHNSIYWQESTYKDPRYALILFISNFYQLSCVIVSP